MTEGKQGFVIAEQLMSGETTDLGASFSHFFIQRDQLLLLLAIDSAGTLRISGETVAL